MINVVIKKETHFSTFVRFDPFLQNGGCQLCIRFSFDSRDGFEVGPEEVRLVTLNLAVLNGDVIEVSVQLHSFVGCRSVLILLAETGTK